MSNLRYGIVTFKGEPAGELTETAQGGTRFSYYADAPEIACALPRSQNDHVYTGGVHPVFQQLAPEGWLRDRQAAVSEANTEDTFGLLLAFGADCIGAIGIEDPEGLDFAANLNAQADQQTIAVADSKRTISGVQPKILSYRKESSFYPATNASDAPYIAKCNNFELTNLVQNEAVSLELCALLLPKEEVNRFEIDVVNGFGGGLSLLVTRFDRVGEHFRTKLRCEDFAQVLGRSIGHDFRNKYNAEYSDLRAALEYSSAPSLDAVKVFARIVAFAILGNTDCHLKNWSLLEGARGLRLSPIYDVLNTYLYAGQNFSTRFGLQLDGETPQWDTIGEPTLRVIGEQLGLNTKTIDLTLRQVKSRKEKLFKRLEQSLGLDADASYQYRANVLTKWDDIYG